MKAFKLKPACLALAALVLVACNGQAKNPDPADASLSESAVKAVAGAELAPHQVITHAAAALKANNLATFLKVTMPTEQYKRLDDIWAKKKSQPVSAKEKAQFKKRMQRLTQENAVSKIMKKLKPKLKKMQAKLPMMIGMFSGIAQAAIAQNKKLDKQAKKQAKQLISSVSRWALSTNLASPKLARKAVTVAVHTARDLDVPTIKAAKTLSFDELMGKGARILKGVKGILGVYNLDVNKILASVDAKTVKKSNGKATVKTTFMFLGSPQTVRTTMVQYKGQWVSKKALKRAKRMADKGNGEAAPDATGK